MNQKTLSSLLRVLAKKQAISDKFLKQVQQSGLANGVLRKIERYQKGDARLSLPKLITELKDCICKGRSRQSRMRGGVGENAANKPAFAFKFGTSKQESPVWGQEITFDLSDFQDALNRLPQARATERKSTSPTKLKPTEQSGKVLGEGSYGHVVTTPYQHIVLKKFTSELNYNALAHLQAVLRMLSLLNPQCNKDTLGDRNQCKNVDPTTFIMPNQNIANEKKPEYYMCKAYQLDTNMFTLSNEHMLREMLCTIGLFEGLIPKCTLVHGDLKNDNIMMSSQRADDPNNTLLLTDIDGIIAYDKQTGQFHPFFKQGVTFVASPIYINPLYHWYFNQLYRQIDLASINIDYTDCKKIAWEEWMHFMTFLNMHASQASKNLMHDYKKAFKKLYDYIYDKTDEINFTKIITTADRYSLAIQIGLNDPPELLNQLGDQLIDIYSSLSVINFSYNNIGGSPSLYQNRLACRRSVYRPTKKMLTYAQPRVAKKVTTSDIDPVYTQTYYFIYDNSKPNQCTLVPKKTNNHELAVIRDST